jgi:predicted ABC-type transport system involved in lysophospholipase L1 biosynthesis ATPase subunit
MTLLALDQVSRRFETGRGKPLTVLDGLSLALEAGRSLAIVGPSGCGKSTLLHLMGALDTPSDGRIVFDGRDLAELDDRERARLRNTSLGFVFQAHHLLPQCSVLENVLVPTLVRGCGADDQQRARDLLDRVGLADRLDHRPGQLSGGECQRVAVVRALINRPRLVLADEPTGSLDRSLAGQLVDLLVELNREQGVALVMVTHAIDLARRLQRVVELRDGRLASSRPQVST